MSFSFLARGEPRREQKPKIGGLHLMASSMLVRAGTNQIVAPASSLLDVSAATVKELLAGYAAILDELRQREIVRSSNNPVCDYGELLFCRAFDWNRKGNSSAGYDATDDQGLRYQIKARRLTRQNHSRQLSAIRKIDSSPFDQLAGVLFDEAFQVVRAGMIPLAVVQTHSTYVQYSNSWRFLLRDEIWEAPGVRDVTPELGACAARMLASTARSELVGPSR